jgi:dihydrofolate reductase
VSEVPERVGPTIVVAVGPNGAIGRRGGLPWHASEDLAHFKAVTMGHHLVVGASTWESIGRPLPGRTMVVVSRRTLELPDGVLLAGSPEDALGLALGADHSPVVAGGTTIYEQLLPSVVRIHRTDVAEECPDADAFFPALASTDWVEVAARAGEDERLTFRVLDRVP